MWEANASTSDVFGHLVKLGGQFSFIYVDGDHSEPAVRRDYLNASKHLEPSGFLLFDDSFDGNKFGTSPVMAEVMADPSFELVMKNPNYLFRKLQ